MAGICELRAAGYELSTMNIKKRLPKGKAGGYFGLGITSVIWGTTWVASKIGVAEIPALQMASIRQFLGGICFVLFFMLYKKLSFPTLQQFGWLLIMAIVMFVLANGLSTWSLKFIPTGLSALVGALYPLSMVILRLLKKTISIITTLNG